MKTACVLYFLSLIFLVKSDLTHEKNLRKTVEDNGYPFETHEVQTKDNYFLSLHRISEGKNKTCNKKGPILLMHGLFSSSDNWVLLSLEKGLAFKLANECYDVWLGNQRGNAYSRKHLTLDPDKNASKFFDFSFYEIGYYDLPAMVDFILNKTEKKQISYVGHSQGTTVFFVMTSERPEYNSKVRFMEAMSPIAYLGNLSNPSVRIAANFWKEIKAFFDMIALYEFRIKDLTKIYKNFVGLCKISIFKIVCKFLNKFRKSFPLEILNNPSAGISSKQLYHFAQEIISHKFQKYDYGKKENLRRYGRPDPSSYNLTKITTPISIAYAVADKFSNEKDISKLFRDAPAVRNIFKVPSKTFKHIDFLYESSEEKAVKALYNHLIMELNKH